MNLEVIQKLATDLAKEAGEELLKNLKSVKVIRFKDRQDIVTTLDYKIEKIFLDTIRKKFPDHSINTEETGVIKGKSDFTWIIDPLDGSKYYIRKIPLFNTSIALQYKDELIFGLVYNPTTKEMFYAQKTKGAYLNKEKIRISNQENLQDAFIYVELPSFDMPRSEFNKYSRILTSLNLNTYRVRVFGSGPLGLCYVASGAFEAYITLGKPPKIQDIAAGLVIAREAGGNITDLDGNSIKLKKNGVLILASNGKVHNKILNLVKQSIF